MIFEELLNTLGSGLKQFAWNDLLDILLMALLLYKLIVWTKDTRAFEVLKGVGLLFVCSVLSELLQLHSINWLLSSILESGSIIIVLFILFTPELRRVLERLGRSGKKIGKLISESGSVGSMSLVNDMCHTILRLSRRRVGALLVFEQKTGLGDIVATGTVIEGLLSGALVENIFEPNTPLHDGAVICRGSTVVAAACFLPLSEETDVDRELGTRHRAALGVSSVSDCLVLVVSEESGAVSLAKDGKLVRYLDEKAIKDALISILVNHNSGFSLFRRNKKENKK